MKIIINETGNAYNLTMQEWANNGWSQDIAGEIIIDNSYHWDNDVVAWYMDGGLDNLIDYLQDWEQYNTDVDRDAYDVDERTKLRDNRPRNYNLHEISEV